jgi:acetyl-CoA carboxylase carboxyl transferase subunit alpha
MTMAEKFGLPVITLVDSAGAYPGVSAEERGQAEAIARSTAGTTPSSTSKGKAQ